VPRRPAEPRLVALVEVVRERLDDVTEGIVALISEQMDMYRGQALVSRDELRAAVRDNVGRVLDQLAHPHAPDIALAREIGRERAAQGTPLAEVLRAYRLGFAYVWDQLLASARETGPHTADALLDAARDLWVLADENATAVTESYRTEMTARSIATDRRRSALVDALITGPVGEQNTAWEIAKLLDMPFEGAFLVAVAETAHLGDSAMPLLENRLRSLDVASAWRTQPDHEIGILSHGRRRRTEEVLEAITGAATTRVGVSPAFLRLDQSPRAARFARVAMETMPAGHVGMRQMSDAPLTELVMSNLGTTRRFVRRVLHDVLDLPEDDLTVLLDTASAWLDAKGSAAEAGRVLFCHENTVRNRLRRFEQYLGRSMDDPTAQAEITTALQAIRTFPELADRRTDHSSDN
jgi:hypothetical protein